MRQRAARAALRCCADIDADVIKSMIDRENYYAHEMSSLNMLKQRSGAADDGGGVGTSGGRGGDVIFEGASNLNTLVDFRYQQHIKAGRGGHGMGRNRTGGKGKTIIVKVPIGTQILEDDKETLIADILRDGARKTIVKGGDGGRGNARFKTSTNQAPRRADQGFLGEEKWVWSRVTPL